MTKAVAIKAGYRLTITTWENDADNYQTKIKDGILDLNTVKFYCGLELIHNDGRRGFGNLYEPSKSQIANYLVAINTLIKKYPDIQIYPGQTVSEANDVSDECYELGLTGGDFYTRVLESIKVEYSQVDVFVDDVTDQFIV